MPCGAAQDGQVVAKSFDKMWSSGEGNGKPLQCSCLESTMNSIKRRKDRTLKDELPRSAGAQHATGEKRRNNCRKKEETEPKKKQHRMLRAGALGRPRGMVRGGSGGGFRVGNTCTSVVDSC